MGGVSHDFFFYFLQKSFGNSGGINLPPEFPKLWTCPTFFWPVAKKFKKIHMSPQSFPSFSNFFCV